MIAALERLLAYQRTRIDAAFRVAIRNLDDHTPAEETALWDAREAAYLLPCRCARQIALEGIR